MLRIAIPRHKRFNHFYLVIRIRFVIANYKRAMKKRIGPCSQFKAGKMCVLSGVHEFLCGKYQCHQPRLLCLKNLSKHPEMYHGKIKIIVETDETINFC